MDQIYVIIGGCEVGGVQNGGEISHERLVGLGANVDALIQGGHLQPKPAGRASKSGAGGDK